MEPSEQSDAELVAQVLHDHADAFDTLMARYKRPLFQFVYRLLGNPTDAEDVTQDVFVRAYQHLTDYDPQQKFSTWLFSFAHHAAIDRLRWRRRHPAESLTDDSPLADRASVTDEVQSRELGEEIATAVQSLPDDQQTAILLAEYQGLSQTEIADIMDCSLKSVESRLYRARQTLRQKLAHLMRE